MDVCDTVFTPATIINKFSSHVAVKNIMNQPNLSALDIGCASGMAMAQLYHDLSFKELIGVELMPEKDIIKNSIKYLHENSIVSKARSLHGIYKKVLIFNAAEIAAGHFHLSKKKFQNQIKIHFSTEASQYFDTLNKHKQFHYIVLSNVLHLNPHHNMADEILQNSTKYLMPGGLIFVRVNHKDNPNAIRLNHLKYDENTFYSLFNKYNSIHTCITPKNDYTQSMLYFGTKI